MRAIYYLTILVITGYLKACSGNEVRSEYYTNGQLKESTEYRGDLPHGYFKAYYESGDLRASGSFEEGIMVGTWKYWYKDGTQMSEGVYKDGQLTNMQAWDKVGNQTIKDCNGTAILYYPTGVPMSQVSYKNCLMDGKWITWFEDGNVESEFYYDAGIPTGIWKFWNPDGTLQKAEKHDGGMEN